MGRLKAIPDRLKPIGDRLKPALGRADSEAKRLRDRDASVHWRKWYKTQRWRNLRIEILTRDAWTCQKTGVICLGTYPADNSAVVDHIRPHHGDEALFWDPTKLQTVSKAYHDRTKQAEERSTHW